MVKERYLINEAAKEVHVESHVLRYWEEELGLPIKRNEQGHRIYTQEDIDRFIRIKDLKDQGLQLKAVKTVLNLDQSDDGGDEEMRAGNPFAQKQLTKLSRTADAKVVPLKSSAAQSFDERWNERFGTKKPESADVSTDTRESQGAKTMIEIKEMRPLPEGGGEEQGDTLTEAEKKEQTMRLQYLFQKLIKEAVAEGSEEMTEQIVSRVTQNVKDDLCKELDYQFRLMEEQNEARAASRQEQEDKRTEEYYKHIDELLRQYSGKKTRTRERVREKNKEKNREKEKEKAKEKTIKFPLSKEEPAQKDSGQDTAKAKKEFHLFRKTAQAKME